MYNKGVNWQSRVWPDLTFPEATCPTNALPRLLQFEWHNVYVYTHRYNVALGFFFFFLGETIKKGKPL